MNMSREDLARSFEGSWLGYRTEDGIEPFRVDGISDSRKFISEHRPNTDPSDPNVVYQYPDLGMVAIGDSVYWTERESARQWVRGVRGRHLRITKLGGNNFNFDQYSGNKEQFMRRLFNPDYTSNTARYSRTTARFAAKVEDRYYYRGVLVGTQETINDLSVPHVKHYIETTISTGG